MCFMHTVSTVVLMKTLLLVLALMNKQKNKEIFPKTGSI